MRYLTGQAGIISNLTLTPEALGTWAHPVTVPWSALPFIDSQNRPPFFTHDAHEDSTLPQNCLPSGGINLAHWRATRIYR